MLHTDLFSERLQQKRTEKGLSQNALAKKVGVSRSLYNKYERAGTRPSHETLILLSNELNTTVDYLIGNTDDPTPPAKKDDNDNDKYKDYIKNFTGLDFSNSNYIYIMGSNGTSQKILIPPEKIERFKKLIEAGMPEILEDDYSDL